MDDVLEKLPEAFNMLELFAKAEDKTPYVLVALQECERMNTLTSEMTRSLREVDLGLKVSVCGGGGGVCGGTRCMCAKCVWRWRWCVSGGSVYGGGCVHYSV